MTGICEVRGLHRCLETGQVERHLFADACPHENLERVPMWRDRYRCHICRELFTATDRITHPSPRDWRYIDPYRPTVLPEPKPTTIVTHTHETTPAYVLALIGAVGFIAGLVLGFIP